MAKRKRIGISFHYDENWAGGLYYLLNIINSFNFLEEEEKPIVVVFYKYEGVKKLIENQYPYIEFLPWFKKWTFRDRVIGKIIRTIFKRKYQLQYPTSIVDFVFPCDYVIPYEYYSFDKLRKIYWIPDFQHHHLPVFFKKEELETRNANFRQIADINGTLVLSSRDAEKDFKKFYPNYQAKVEVVSFASVLPDFSHINSEATKEKYGLNKPYFFSPNQFWAHKNHMVLLKAISILKKKGLLFQVAFTGKESDYRNVDYIDHLKEYIKKEELQSHVVFLGFIDRLDQLSLMKNAIAVIQPSLFEGWSTVVEDAKAIGQRLILSNLLVHIEQCSENVVFFDPHNENQLAEEIEKSLKMPLPIKQLNYSVNIVAYAKRILSL